MKSNNDILEEIKNFPQSSIGAPIPVILSDEHSLFLLYYIEDAPDDWDGTTVRVVGIDSNGEMVSIVTFNGYRAFKFGPPNDEAISGHPLYKKGLSPYSIYKVHSSSWIEELEKMNSVHREHDKSLFDSLIHFIFVFHDSTFECVAEGMNFEVKNGIDKKHAESANCKVVRPSA